MKLYELTYDELLIEKAYQERMLQTRRCADRLARARRRLGRLDAEIERRKATPGAGGWTSESVAARKPLISL